MSQPNALVALAGTAVAIGSFVYDHRHPPPSNHSIPVADGGAAPARLPTGHLAAVDPLVFIDAAAPLEPAVAPGSYPVVVRVHQGDVALALLMIGGARPVRWAPARTTAHADPSANPIPQSGPTRWTRSRPAPTC